MVWGINCEGLSENPYTLLPILNPDYRALDEEKDTLIFNFIIVVWIYFDPMR